jgi:hypothetical protein
MKINLTKKEYLALLDIFEIADWVLHSHKVEQPAETKPYSDLEQKMLALAEDFGCGHLVDYSEADKRYYPTREVEEGPAMQFIEMFEEDTFWSRIVERLAERDLVRELGKEKFATLDRAERWEKMEDLETRYWDEFQMHGVERLEIVETPWYETPDMHSA